MLNFSWIVDVASGCQGVDHILAVLKSRNDISGNKLKIAC